jgi:hypothetical protein
MVPVFLDDRLNDQGVGEPAFFDNSGASAIKCEWLDWKSLVTSDLEWFLGEKGLPSEQP